MLCWGANIKCFEVPLFRKYFNVPSSLLDNILGRFIFNATLIIACVQSTRRIPHNSNSRVHRRLKNGSRKQNSKSVHAKITDNCFEAISPLKLVISKTGFVFHEQIPSVCLKCMFLQWYSEVLAQKMHDIFCLQNIIFVYIGKDEQGKHSNYRVTW